MRGNASQIILKYGQHGVAIDAEVGLTTVLYILYM